MSSSNQVIFPEPRPSKELSGTAAVPEHQHQYECQCGSRIQPNTYLIVASDSSPPIPVSESFKPTQSSTVTIVLSCLTFWLCGVIFGLIAFILAILGRRSKANGDEASSRRMTRASFVTSIVGIVVGVIVIVVVLSVVLTNECHRPEKCFYGTYKRWDGCLGCCEAYNSADCVNNGRYFDYSYGCQKCCTSLNLSNCYMNRYKYDINACKICCTVNDYINNCYT